MCNSNLGKHPNSCDTIIIVVVIGNKMSSKGLSVINASGLKNKTWETIIARCNMQAQVFTRIIALSVLLILFLQPGRLYLNFHMLTFIITVKCIISTLNFTSESSNYELGEHEN